MTVQVLDPREPHYGVKMPNLFAAPKWSVEPGEELSRSGAPATTRAVRLLSWSRRPAAEELLDGAGRTQEPIEQPVNEAMRGGFTLRVTYVRENRAYLERSTSRRALDEQGSTVKWEHFV